MDVKPGKTWWPRGAGAQVRLSSARVVRCWVKSCNEHQPLSHVASIQLGTPCETAGVSRRKVGTTSSHPPFIPGLHTCYNGRYNGLRDREVERIPQSRPQFRIRRLATRLREVELLVIADQHAAVNTFRALLHTARHTTWSRAPGSRPNPQGRRRRRCGG